jgi:hypothetical protein
MALLPDSFTVKSAKGELCIITDIGISTAFDEYHERQVPTPLKTRALWDTGASHCFITASLARKLDLVPVRRTRVGHAKGSSTEDVYVINLHITPKYYVEVEVTECQSDISSFDVIIGMEVISQGDFAITSKRGVVTFSFRLPSQTHIDFTIDSKV